MNLRLVLLLLLTGLVAGCTDPPPVLERIQAAGELVVVTRNSPTTYYEGPEGIKGLEYDLVQLFAEELKVKARVVLADSLLDIIGMVTDGSVHIAAAGLAVLPSRETRVKFAPSYQEITPQVVYRAGNRRPKSVTDLVDSQLEIMAGSSHEVALRRFKKQYPELTWQAHLDLESEQLLYLVREQVIDYTVANSNEVALNRRYYPELRVAFDLTEPLELAWALPHSPDSSLYDEVTRFFEKIKQDGTLDQLLERYYGYVESLNLVDNRTFQRHVAQRLPVFVTHFLTAEEETGLDWRLLAAIGYQESHWNPEAVSPTGVRGIMMLTMDTAKRLQVVDRSDPEESILGGARYMRMVENKIPERIPEPDRLWFTLAGYNVGFGHLEDARILTQTQGADPDKWADVKQRLPLLSQKKWYETTRHGYARGREPVTYVDNVRSYYDLLTWRFPREPVSPPPPYPLTILPEAL